MGDLKELTRSFAQGRGNQPTSNSLGLICSHIEEIPDEDGVIVRAADDLELVELEAEHPTGMLLKTRVTKQSGNQVSCCYIPLECANINYWQGSGDPGPLEDPKP